MPELIFRMERSAPCKAEQFLRQDCGLSHRQLLHLKHTPDGITVNGRLLRTVDTVFPGEEVHLRFEDEKHLEPNPALHVPIAFEDEDLLLFDKPAGMPVHPSLHHHGDTLGNAFAAQFPALTFRPVHRLDQDTSGLVAVAKHAPAAAQLPGRLQKTYLALVSGSPPEEGIITAPIGRTPESIIARRVDPQGQTAVTHFRTLAQGRYALVELTLETGRTHQIRVHMAHIGHPLAGDGLYGGDQSQISRHALHCAVMTYTDRSGRLHRIESPLPADLRALLPDIR